MTQALTNFPIFFSGSLLALGALFGSLSAVYLMDAVGRKASLLAFSVMSLFIGWTLLMAASQIWQLYTGRFLLGLGAGMEITICPVYIHETCRPYLRDVCGSFPQVSNLNFLAQSQNVCCQGFPWANQVFMSKNRVKNNRKIFEIPALLSCEWGNPEWENLK